MLTIKKRIARAKLEVAGTALILLGLFSLILGFVFDEETSKDAAFSVASGLLGGGVFAWLTKLAQFSGVFSDEIEKIIYGERHLADRADNEKLWLNATRSLYGERFPKLLDRLSPATLKAVWPSTERFYLVDARRTLKLQLTDREAGVVEVKNSLSSKLTTDTGPNPVVRRSTYEFHRNTMSDDELEHFVANVRATYKQIDGGKEISDRVEKTVDVGGGFVRAEYCAELKAGTTYKFSDSNTHNMRLADDNVSAFLAMSYVDGLTTAVKYSKQDLIVQFFPIGPVVFTDCEPKLADIHKETKDLLFSDLGFLITIQLVPEGTRGAKEVLEMATKRV